MCNRQTQNPREGWSSLAIQNKLSQCKTNSQYEWQRVLFQKPIYASNSSFSVILSDFSREGSRKKNCIDVPAVATRKKNLCA